MVLATVRPAREGDVQQMTAIFLEQQRIEQELDPRLRLQSPEMPKWEHFVEPSREDHRICLIVEASSDVLGLIVLSTQATEESSRTCGVIQTLAIDPHKGQGGIGSLLLDAAFSWFREFHIRDVLVQNVPNTIAVQQAFWHAKKASVVRQQLYLSLPRDE